MASAPLWPGASVTDPKGDVTSTMARSASAASADEATRPNPRKAPKTPTKRFTWASCPPPSEGALRRTNRDPSRMVPFVVRPHADRGRILIYNNDEYVFLLL